MKISEIGEVIINEKARRQKMHQSRSMVFLTGAMSALAGAEEIGGFLMVVASLAFCMCAMIDKVNEIPAAAPSAGSTTQWFDDETSIKPKHQFMEYKDPNVGVAGARREIIGVRADFQSSPSRFFADDRKS